MVLWKKKERSPIFKENYNLYILKDFSNDILKLIDKDNNTKNKKTHISRKNNYTNHNNTNHMYNNMDNNIHNNMHYTYYNNDMNYTHHNEYQNVYNNYTNNTYNYEYNDNIYITNEDNLNNRHKKN